MFSLITKINTKSYNSDLQIVLVCSVYFETLLTSIAAFWLQECNYNYIIM